VVSTSAGVVDKLGVVVTILPSFASVRIKIYKLHAVLTLDGLEDSRWRVLKLLLGSSYNRPFIGELVVGDS